MGGVAFPFETHRQLPRSIAGARMCPPFAELRDGTCQGTRRGSQPPRWWLRTRKLSGGAFHSGGLSARRGSSAEPLSLQVCQSEPPHLARQCPSRERTPHTRTPLSVRTSARARPRLAATCRAPNGPPRGHPREGAVSEPALGRHLTLRQRRGAGQSHCGSPSHQSVRLCFSDGSVLIRLRPSWSPWFVRNMVPEMRSGSASTQASPGNRGLFRIFENSSRIPSSGHHFDGAGGSRADLRRGRPRWANSRSWLGRGRKEGQR